jgi:hypothetical protein
MKKTNLAMIMMVPLAVVFLLGYMIPGEALGAAVVLDETQITYSPMEPTLDDEFNVTVDPIFIDAEPKEDGVVLMWSLCTDDGCGIAKPMTMTDNGDGTWSANLGGPFQKTDTATGKDYVDILFYVKITAIPTGGGDDIIEQSDSIEVYFNDTHVPTDDDDDDTTLVDDDDDDDDSDDSPFGLEVLLIGVVLVGAYAVYRRRN